MDYDPFFTKFSSKFQTQCKYSKPNSFFCLDTRYRNENFDLASKIYRFFNFCFAVFLITC